MRRLFLSNWPLWNLPCETRICRKRPIVTHPPPSVHLKPFRKDQGYYSGWRMLRLSFKLRRIHVYVWTFSFQWWKPYPSWMRSWLWGDIEREGNSHFGTEQHLYVNSYLFQAATLFGWRKNLNVGKMISCMLSSNTSTLEDWPSFASWLFGVIGLVCVPNWNK